MDLASPSTNPTYSSPVTTSPTTTTTTTLATTTSPSSTPSRYENQKRRDLNTFCQYLRNHRPPLSLPMCSGAHVLEFLRYIDQFGKTKVHNQTCPFFGLPNPPAPCPCPLRQAWGTLDALIGRLRAAYEEQHGGRPEGNPFGAKAVRIYLREVRDFQAKARGLSYMKKRKGPKLQDDLKSGWTGPISASAQEQNNVDMAQQQEPLLTGIEPANDFTGAGIEPANDLTGAGIELPRDTPDDQDELKKLEGSKYRDMVDDFKSGWTLLMTNLILEMASAVFDQLGYALVGMVLAFVALLLSTADLIHMARKERMSLLPSSLCTSTATLAPGKPVGTIVEYFGLVGAVWQCFYSTVEYTYARQKRDNPIKMCLLPFIFLFCVVISKLIKKSYIDKSA